MRRAGFVSGGYIFDTFGQELAAKEDSFDEPLETLLSRHITELSQEDVVRYLSGVYKIVNEGLLLAKFVQHGLLQRLQEVVECRECHTVNKYFVLITRALLLSRDKSVLLEVQHDRGLQTHLLRLYLSRDFATSGALIDVLSVLMEAPCLHTARCFMTDKFVLSTAQRIISLPAIPGVGERLLSLLLSALRGACDGEMVRGVVPRELLVGVMECARDGDIMHISARTLALDFLATYCERGFHNGESDGERSMRVVALGGMELVEEGVREILEGMRRGVQGNEGSTRSSREEEGGKDGGEDLLSDVPALECPFKTVDLGAFSTQLVRLACALSYSSSPALLRMVHVEGLNRAVISTATIGSFGDSLALLLRPQDWDRVREETRREVSNGYYVHLPLLLSEDVKALCRQVRIACVTQQGEEGKEKEKREGCHSSRRAALAFTKIISNTSGHRETMEEIFHCRTELINVSSELLYLYRNDGEVVESVARMLLGLGVKSEEDSELSSVVETISSLSSSSPSLKALLNVEKPQRGRGLSTAHRLMLVALFIECVLVVVLVLKVSQKRESDEDRV